MKFEKFLKGCGTHGHVISRNNGDKWLLCAGVGMKIPEGVVNLLGAGEMSDKIKNIVTELVTSDTDVKVALTRATITKDGKASDIIRIFEDAARRTSVQIKNEHFGLLEKSDYNLSIAEIEAVDNGYDNSTPFLLILDPSDEVIGFIEGLK